MNAAYDGQSQRVGSEAGKAAQYSSLRREVETQRNQYQTLLVQQNEANLSSSVPVNPIRVVEAAAAPEAPYKPRPVLNISFGRHVLAWCWPADCFSEGADGPQHQGARRFPADVQCAGVGSDSEPGPERQRRW